MSGSISYRDCSNRSICQGGIEAGKLSFGEVWLDCRVARPHVRAMVDVARSTDTHSRGSRHDQNRGTVDDDVHVTVDLDSDLTRMSVSRNGTATWPEAQRRLDL